jgi:biotin carboxyl carrier protein
MKRQVTVNGQQAQIEITGSSVRYKRDDGAEVVGTFSIDRTRSSETSVVLNGRVYRVSRGRGREVWVNGRRLSLAVFDPRDLQAGSGAVANHGRQEVAASMPGKVIRVLVAAGDQVEQGQGLVVVEAMKMQNEMKSPKAGKVAEVRARPDATVGAGEVLVVVE